jgi:hypothetical protein
MKVIYKYPLEIKDDQYIKLPKGSRLLSACEQYENIVIYALVDDNAEDMEDYNFVIHGTGHYADDVFYNDYQFLGTVKLRGGALIFHVFGR